MCDPEVPPRELQNHFLQMLHMTTVEASLIPQYRQLHEAK
jgi:hypothetical protein